jgi:hypothetical protein
VAAFKENQSMSKQKLYALAALTLSGATLFQGCLNSFWEGLFSTGFDYGQNRYVDLALDIVREDLFS